jgi:chromosome segregation ATPase
MPDISEQNIIFTLTQVYEDKAQQFDKDLENREKRVSLTNAMAKKALQEFGNVVKQQGVTASKVVGDIDKLFDKIGNKKFNNKSIDAEIKDLKELKNALIIAEKEYPKLSNESKKAYDKMVTEADQYIVAMNKAIEAEQELINKNSNLTASVSKTAKETKDLSNNLDKTKDKTKEAATTTGDLFDVIDLISPAFGRFGFQIQAVTRGLQAMTTNTGTLARALSFLKTPLGAIGTVAATVGTALTGAFLSSEEGADAFDKKLEGVKQRFRFFGSELSQFAVKLFQGQLSVKDFDFSNIFAQFDRIKKQANEAQATGERVSVLRDQLEEEQVNSIVEVAKKQAEAFELRDKYYGIENDNLDNITEKRSLLTQIEKKNSELSQIKIKEAETLLEIEKELLAVKGAGATTADKRKVAEAEVNLANEEKAAEQIKRFTTKQLVVLNNAKEAIEKETRDVLNTFADTIESNALSVKEFKTTVPPIEVDPEIQADEIARIKKTFEKQNRPN